MHKKNFKGHYPIVAECPCPYPNTLSSGKPRWQMQLSCPTLWGEQKRRAILIGASHASHSQRGLPLPPHTTCPVPSPKNMASSPSGQLLRPRILSLYLLYFHLFSLNSKRGALFTHRETQCQQERHIRVSSGSIYMSGR